jgi:hypothetical protein
VNSSQFIYGRDSLLLTTHDCLAVLLTDPFDFNPLVANLVHALAWTETICFGSTALLCFGVRSQRENDKLRREPLVKLGEYGMDQDHLSSSLDLFRPFLSRAHPSQHHWDAQARRRLVIFPVSLTYCCIRVQLENSQILWRW